MSITYIGGDLFEGIKAARKPLLIPHVCNDAGRWGKGFVLDLGRHFPLAKKIYSETPSHRLGEVKIVLVSKGIYVANMIAQHGVGGVRPLRYSALVDCMGTVRGRWSRERGGIHAPMFGAGLGGGNWNFIEALIQEIWCDAGYSVTVYRKGGQ